MKLKRVVIDPVPEGEWTVQSLEHGLLITGISPTAIHIEEVEE